jgi:hypothetical protein
MRKTVLSLAVFSLFLCTSAVVAAAESAEVVPAITASVSGAEAPVTSQLQLNEIQLEQRTAAGPAAEAQVAQRGSFWWLVGAIVIGGIILAVLL